MITLEDFFDVNGFATKPCRFETITDLEGHALDFYQSVYQRNMHGDDGIRKGFSNFLKSRSYTEEEQTLVALALERYFFVEGMERFIEE